VNCTDHYKIEKILGNRFITIGKLNNFSARAAVRKLKEFKKPLERIWSVDRYAFASNRAGAWN
jgi:hypothetical protein